MLQRDSAGSGRAWRSGLAGAILAASALSAHASGAEIALDVTRDGDSLVIHATADLASDVGSAWSALTDYRHYPDFIPGVRASEVVEREGDRVVVRQSTTATLGPLRAPVDLVYRVSESPPDRIASSAAVARIGTLDSRYTLRAQGERVRLDYLGRLTTASELARPLVNAVGERTLARQFRALADEIERRARPSAPRPDETR